ncbi:MAG TPA: zf-HC2 domain-containing protein [Acidobacteriota bacterium]|nr:zf-HC2 domain-containing protein [Acidobacteriota bacterium]
MKDCKNIKKDLVAYIYNEIDEQKKSQIQEHLNSCPECQKEVEELKEVLLCADTYKKEINEAVESVDWEALPSQIADQVIPKNQTQKQSTENKFKKLLNSIFTARLAPVYAALLAGIIMGGVLTFMILRPGRAPEGTAPTQFMVSRDFIETMDVEMARRETLDYLEQSKYLLLDFVQTSPEKADQYWKSDFVEAKTSELLSKKRYMNQQLDKHHMAKAKAICDQIEILLMELAGMRGELSAAESRRIRDLIEQRQILLKINLVKKELQQSEV